MIIFTQRGEKGSKLIITYWIITTNCSFKTFIETDLGALELMVDMIVDNMTQVRIFQLNVNGQVKHEHPVCLCLFIHGQKTIINMYKSCSYGIYIYIYTST